MLSRLAYCFLVGVELSVLTHVRSDAVLAHHAEWTDSPRLRIHVEHEPYHGTYPIFLWRLNQSSSHKINPCRSGSSSHASIPTQTATLSSRFVPTLVSQPSKSTMA